MATDKKEAQILDSLKDKAVRSFDGTTTARVLGINWSQCAVSIAGENNIPLWDFLNRFEVL